MEDKSYIKLTLMFILHFIAMYLLMYAMVNNLFDNAYNSLNQVYMAGLMTASMGAIEIAIMSSMYPNKKRNILILIVSVLALILFWVLIRQQTAISDEQFIRSMIPHHSGAILMCERTELQDPELSQLCENIIDNQQSEIDEMKNILQRLNAK